MSNPVAVSMRHEAIIAAYQAGQAIPDIARRFGHGISWIRFILIRADVIEKPAYQSDPFFLQRALEVASSAVEATPAQLLSPCRDRSLVRARFAVMRACRCRGMSLHSIARRFNRDHSSVVYAERQAPLLAKRYPDFADLLARVDAA